jgi:hypothetical protein
MKRIISLAVILIIAFVIAGCSSKQAVENTQTQGQAVLQEQNQEPASQDAFVQENSCPRGVTDDPYPGDCWQYADQNQDSLCDLGQ